jgi:small nuclear ribonucleoprotein (snRNP)-like protein
LCVPTALQAYDEHMNLVLGEVVEKVSTIEVDSDTMVESCKVRWQCCS